MAQNPPSPQPGEPVNLDGLLRALDALEAACRELDAAILAVQPPQRAFELATEAGILMTAAMRSRASWAADLRNRMVARIWKAEELSLAHLAERIGVSKARADQMTRAAQAANKREE